MSDPDRSQKSTKRVPAVIDFGISRRTIELTDAAIEAATGVPREQQVGYVPPSEPHSRRTSRS